MTEKMILLPGSIIVAQCPWCKKVKEVLYVPNDNGVFPGPDAAWHDECWRQAHIELAGIDN